MHYPTNQIKADAWPDASIVGEPHATPIHYDGLQPLLPRSKRQTARIDVIVEPTTGPFHKLAGRSTLVALDLENIDRSASNIGRAVNYHLLAAALRQGIGQATHLICVYSYGDYDSSPDPLLRAAGWATYVRPVDTVRTLSGVVRHGNADVSFATAVGAAVTALDIEACVLATGDGQLAIDVARCVLSIAPRCKVAATLSLPGSTSRRLDARRSDLFAVNLEIGDDVMNRVPNPLRPSRKIRGGPLQAARDGTAMPRLPAASF